jgi:hypothetical protein
VGIPDFMQTEARFLALSVVKGCKGWQTMDDTPLAFRLYPMGISK